MTKNPHPSVKYIEPNFTFSGLTAAGGGEGIEVYDRAPDLEDFCIAMDIEVLLATREKSAKMSTENRLIILSYRSDTHGESNISFMSGTVMGGYQRQSDGSFEPRLGGQQNVMTTSYADMYTTDLLDHGTTELLGIKSIDVEYNSTCVPVITVRFTDVRGMSLFQPSEINHTSYNGINGFSSDNVAQSFFQAFFTLPLPLFKIRLKGLYGRPVSYQVQCDKFETSFNSEDGSFDVTVRFIGFAYSFMADVSMNALLAAPYSDYEGESFWNNKVANGEFTLIGKYGEIQPMPRLYDVRKKFETIITQTNEFTQPTPSEVEVNNHETEIRELTSIRNMYRKWYESLYAAAKGKLEDGLVYLSGGIQDSDYKRIIIFTTFNGDDDKFTDMINGDSGFSECNESLHNAVEEFNKSSEAYRKLDNVSIPFKFKKTKFFKDFTEDGGTITYNGFEDTCQIPEDERIETETLIFGTEDKENEEKFNQFYHGIEGEQYVYAYVIEVKYDDIGERIKLLSHISSNTIKNASEERLLLNDKLYELLGWYPSIENYTKIVMAHLETLMHMFYCVEEGSKGRTISSMGISQELLADVPSKYDTVGPFPRMTELIEEDGYTKKQDIWIGKYNSGNGMREVDMVNGLFNAVEELEKIEREIEIVRNNGENPSPIPPNPEYVSIVPLPLTPYDMLLTKTPYGDVSDMDSPAAFAGKVAMRMIGVLGLSGFNRRRYSGEIGDQYYGFNISAYLDLIAKIEAHNYKHFVNLTNPDIVSAISEGGMLSSGSQILDVVTGKTKLPDKLPWSGNGDADDVLIGVRGSDRLWITRYETSNQAGGVHPIQNMSFGHLDEIRGILEQDKYPIEDEDDVIYLDPDYHMNADTLNKLMSNTTVNNSIFNTVTITEDYKKIIAHLKEAFATAETYGLEGVDEFSKDVFNVVVSEDGVTKGKITVRNIILPSVTQGRYSFHEEFGFRTCLEKLIKENAEKKHIQIDVCDEATDDEPYIGLCYNTGEKKSYTYKIDANKDWEKLVEESYERDIKSFTLTEIFGFKRVSDGKNSNGKQVYHEEVNKDKCLFLMPEFYSGGIEGTVNDFGTVTIDYKYLRSARFLFGIDGLDAANGCRNSMFVFGYSPKLTYLQMGAAFTMFYAVHKLSVKFTSKGYNTPREIPLPAIPERLAEALENKVIGTATKLALMKYFRKWVDDNWNRVMSLYLYKNSYNGSIDLTKLYNSNYALILRDNKSNIIKTGDQTVARAILNEYSETIKWFTNDLFSMVCLVHLTADETAVVMEREEKLYQEQAMAAVYGVFKGNAERYLDSFLTELRKITGIKEPGNNPTTLAREPDRTTEAMKIELYRYLKQVYDKWICSTKESDWDYRKFFSEVNNENNPVGNNFFFIDSFYNKIGKKLLINPLRLSKKIRLTTAAMDANVMMFTFLNEVYADHRCMLKCVQNFRMLTDSMDDIFKPLPYNASLLDKALPDFVVIYSYEASRNLAIPNAEYNDDGFMLNNEDELPLPILSRSDENNYYKIPAFGVSYGRQYQSFFKSVNVDMSHPVLTEQALIAKHAILVASRGPTFKNVSAQDAFDIYSNQSYTCKVDMMGCAWIQPLMYFVLLNVPFFRGSYLISNVRHKVVPGNMSTEITGVRMSKYCNKMVTEMVSDQSSIGGSGNYLEEAKHNVANIDNDCPYKVFPVGNMVGSFSGDMPGPLFKAGETNPDEWICTVYQCQHGGCAQDEGWRREFCKTLYHAWLTVEPGLNRDVAKTLVAQAAYESCWGRSKLAIKDRNYGGVMAYSGKASTEEPDGKKYAKFTDVIDYVKGKVNHVLDANFKTWRNATTPESYLRSLFTGQYKYGGFSYEQYSGDVLGILPGVRSRLNGVTDVPDMTPEQEAEYNKNLPKYFFEAVEKSVKTTPNANVSLKATYPSDGVVVITQEGGNSKMSVVFDIILNGYYDYVNKLYWECGQVFDANPTSIKVTVCHDSKTNNGGKNSRKVYIGDGRGTFTDDNFKDKDNPPVAKGFIRSIVKKYISDMNAFKTECTQFASCTEMFKTYVPADCASVVSANNGGGSSEPTTGFSGRVTNPKMKKVLTWVNKICRKHLYNNSSYWYTVRGCPGNRPVPEHSGWCTYGPSTWYAYSDVPDNIFYKSDGTPNENARPTPGSAHDLHFWGDPTDSTNAYRTNLTSRPKFEMVWHGTYEEAKVYQQDLSHFRPGDLCTQRYFKANGSASAHACMWTGGDWRSDYNQNKQMVAGKSFRSRPTGDKYSVCLWRIAEYQEPGLPLK